MLEICKGNRFTAFPRDSLDDASFFTKNSKIPYWGWGGGGGGGVKRYTQLRF